METFTLIIGVLVVIALVVCEVLKINGLKGWEKEVNDTLQAFIDFSKKNSAELDLEKLKNEVIDDIATQIFKQLPKYLQQLYKYEDIEKFINNIWEMLNR